MAGTTTPATWSQPAMRAIGRALRMGTTANTDPLVRRFTEAEMFALIGEEPQVSPSGVVVRPALPRDGWIPFEVLGYEGVGAIEEVALAILPTGRSPPASDNGLHAPRGPARRTQKRVSAWSASSVLPRLTDVPFEGPLPSPKPLTAYSARV